MSEHDDALSLTLSEAAPRTGLSRKTLQRRHLDGAFPNAYRANGPRGAGTGPWRIPVADLIAAGIPVQAPPADDAPTQAPPADDALAETVRDLQRALDAEKAAHAFTRDALQRADENLDDLRTALRMLTPAPVPEPLPANAAPTNAAANTPTNASRSWWQRMRRTR